MYYDYKFTFFEVSDYDKLKNVLTLFGPDRLKPVADNIFVPSDDGLAKEIYDTVEIKEYLTHGETEYLIRKYNMKGYLDALEEKSQLLAQMSQFSDLDPQHKYLKKQLAELDAWIDLMLKWFSDRTGSIPTPPKHLLKISRLHNKKSLSSDSDEKLELLDNFLRKRADGNLTQNRLADFGNYSQSTWHRFLKDQGNKRLIVEKLDSSIDDFNRKITKLDEERKCLENQKETFIHAKTIIDDEILDKNERTRKNKEIPTTAAIDNLRPTLIENPMAQVEEQIDMDISESMSRKEVLKELKTMYPERFELVKAHPTNELKKILKALMSTQNY